MKHATNGPHLWIASIFTNGISRYSKWRLCALQNHSSSYTLRMQYYAYIVYISRLPSNIKLSILFSLWKWQMAGIFKNVWKFAAGYAQCVSDLHLSTKHTTALCSMATPLVSKYFDWHLSSVICLLEDGPIKLLSGFTDLWCFCFAMEMT